MLLEDMFDGVVHGPLRLHVEVDRTQFQPFGASELVQCRPVRRIAPVYRPHAREDDVPRTCE